jgi:integrase
MLAEIRRGDDPLFIDFVKQFWADDSPYARQKRISEKRPLSVVYVRNSQRVIRLHVAPFPALAGITLSRLKAGQINDWKLWALEKGTGTRTVNYALQAIRVAVRHAVERGDLSADPLIAVKKVAYTPSERGILFPMELKALVVVDEPDPRVKAAVLLAALAGLRRGEVRGLQWGDIDEAKGIIKVEHNYMDDEGIKGCKWGSSRQVMLHSAIMDALNKVKAVSPFTTVQNFILYDPDCATRPVSNQIIKDGFTRVLKNIGINETQRHERKLSFHGLRHGFITTARLAGLPDSVVQSMAGHKSGAMMARYSHLGVMIDYKSAKEALENVIPGTRA